MKILRDFISNVEGQPILILAKNLANDQMIKDTAGEFGYIFFGLDMAEINTDNDLFALLSKKLGFPAYFGYNWNALYDYLTDLGWWLPSKGYIILFKNSDKLKMKPALDFDTFSSVILDVTRFWRSHGIRFGLVLECEHGFL